MDLARSVKFCGELATSDLELHCRVVFDTLLDCRNFIGPNCVRDIIENAKHVFARTKVAQGLLLKL